MKDGVGDRRADSGNSDFTDASTAQMLEFRVENIERVHLDLTDVGVYRNVIFGEVIVYRAAVAWIDVRYFLERQAHAPDDAVHQLAILASSRRSISMSCAGISMCCFIRSKEEVETSSATRPSWSRP